MLDNNDKKSVLCLLMAVALCIVVLIMPDGYESVQNLMKVLGIFLSVVALYYNITGSKS